MGKILVVDDNQDILVAARLLLKQAGHVVHAEQKPDSIPALLKNESYDVVLLDMNFTKDVTSGSEGFHWLNRILAIDPSIVVILMTAYGDVDMAVKVMKAGATDFITKPWQNEKLLATLSVAVNLRSSRREVDDLKIKQKQLSADIDQKYHDMIGSSPAMQKVFETIEKVAVTDASVLILGENGTGKELVARALHRQSPRADQVFISVDMGSIPETLFESELFGHMKGAFTDAKNDKPGRFEVASGGTLFFDEVGNLPLAMQAKLLRVLEERRVTRLGSNQSRPVDIRLVCATNMPISDMVAKKEFRQDFLYRINTVEIRLPVLRERAEDIPLLINYFLETYARRYKRTNMLVSAGAMTKLQTYHWPGNIRELRHALERAIIMADSNVLQPSDFLFPAEPQKEGLVFESYNLDEIEKMIIRKVLAKHQGNISHAASDLGLTRTSLYRRMEKHGL
ncbi:sigma-54-dependent Fis family transcriptional regulator [candidate division KSB1 bacterium]|nr:sigma-54-dependent Fis family transcriptional regulator [candidate division KSB1 bacterium]